MSFYYCVVHKYATKGKAIYDKGCVTTEKFVPLTEILIKNQQKILHWTAGGSNLEFRILDTFLKDVYPRFRFFIVKPGISARPLKTGHIQEFLDHLSSVFPSPLDNLTLWFDVIKVYKFNSLLL